MTVGKHKGKMNLATIYETDKSYISWMRTHTKVESMSEGLLRLRAYAAQRDVRKYNRVARLQTEKEMDKKIETSGPMNRSPVKRRTTKSPDRLVGDSMETGRASSSSPWIQVADPDEQLARWENITEKMMEKNLRKKKTIRNRSQRDMDRVALLVEAAMNAPQRFQKPLNPGTALN